MRKRHLNHFALVALILFIPGCGSPEFELKQESRLPSFLTSLVPDDRSQNVRITIKTTTTDVVYIRIYRGEEEIGYLKGVISEYENEDDKVAFNKRVITVNGISEVFDFGKVGPYITVAQQEGAVSDKEQD